MNQFTSDACTTSASHVFEIVIVEQINLIRNKLIPHYLAISATSLEELSAFIFSKILASPLAFLRKDMSLPKNIGDWQAKKT
ncbi:hypothetical protein [Synechococcus sp. MIT S9501]|uniref:hypothetical protein n=1 Tax=Synechococcus sp. MIT S9501 TaxID=3082545 RepID=UPI0039B60B31